ncbi:MAG: hypothetical protein HZA51_05100 [Planctomycetes bacterium]|nr:hypothetical protein [Planctomycetota bacterium]
MHFENVFHSSESTSTKFVNVTVYAFAIVAIVMSAVAQADSVNSPNITLNVDTNRATATGAGAGNTSIVINTITIAETMLPEYSSGAGKAISIKARPGFQFDPTSNVTAQSATIGFNGGGLNAVATVVPSGAADEVITFSLTSGTNTAVQDIIRINGIRIRILSAAGAAGPAQTTLQLTTSTAGGAFTNQSIVAANIQKGNPDHLVFVAQPGTNQAGADLLPSVKIVDFGGNLLTDIVRPISLAIQTNPGAATLNGTTSRNSAAGLATWVDADNLNITVAATGYTLRATNTGDAFLTGNTVDSEPFDILAGAANHLLITQQPVNTAAGDDILIAVSVFDAMDNLVTMTPTDVSIEAAINPGGWPLLSANGLTKATVNGVATWAAADDLRITKAVADYRLAASGVGSPVFSDLFDITPGTATMLQFVQQPTNTAQNAFIDPPVTVEVTDIFSNRTDTAVDIQLALATAPCGGTLTGGAATSAAGLATFGTLGSDTACDGNGLDASATGFVGASSDLFNVTAVAAPGGADACGAACGAGAGSALVPFLLIGLMRPGRRFRNGFNLG